MSERPRPAGRPRPTGPAPRPPPEPDASSVGAPSLVSRPKGPVGRGIKAQPDDTSAPTEAAPARPHELSPFQKFGGAAEPAVSDSSETVTVISMIIGLVMAVGAALAVVVVVLFFVVTATTGVITVPGVTPRQSTQDTDVAIAGPRAQPKPAGPKSKGPDVAPEPDPVLEAREVSGTILLDLKPGELFHTVEAKCPSTPNVRRRADIRGTKVSITLPNNEDCKLTFQGSLPASGNLRGGQTKTCSFNPTNCR